MLDEDFKKNSTATIFSAHGVRLVTIQLQHDIENINIKSLPAGSYYLLNLKGSRQFVVLK